MKYIVALTGGIGSGKSTVADSFARLAIDVVDADIIAREVVAVGSYGLEKITERYGKAVLNQDGTLNRAKLRQIIFSGNGNNQEKTWLDTLLHPIIRQETQKKIQRSRSHYVVWVVPLLVENKLQRDANRILVVDVPVSLQIQRTINRDNASRTQVESIIASQASRDERLKYADDIIAGDLSLRELESAVLELHSQYLRLACKNRA